MMQSCIVQDGKQFWNTVHLFHWKYLHKFVFSTWRWRIKNTHHHHHYKKRGMEFGFNVPSVCVSFPQTDPFLIKQKDNART